MRLIREEKAFIREAVLLMLPMILQNFVTFSMSMADTFMVGVLGETALAAVTILPGVHIGRCAVIGAGSVVTGDVEAYHLYAGVPARKIRDIRTGERVQ